MSIKLEKLSDKLAEYKITVHSLKGTSNEIFAHEIADKAEALENAAIARDIVFIKDNNGKFIERTIHFIEEIENMLREIEQNKTKPKRDKIDPDLLYRLYRACKIYKISDINDIILEIEQFDYEVDNDFKEWIRRMYDMMEFNQIVSMLSYLEKG